MPSPGADESRRQAAPDPDEIYQLMQTEGRRRLARPPLELASTALVGGFDVAFGVIALGLASAAFSPRFGDDVGRVAGALAFGLGFVFVVVGRSELFTENFLVPIAGLENNVRGWLKLGELWAGTLVLNLVGGLLLTIILTSHDVVRHGTGRPLVDLARHIAEASLLSSFLSGFVAGALMTLMTWFVEGAAGSTGARIAMAWLVGFLIALGGFNHAIVGSVEMMFGMRFGAEIDLGQFFASLGVAVAGNLVGGVGLVTFTRIVQAGAGTQRMSS